MPRKLEVTFKGICAFMPDQPFFVGTTPGKPKTVRVALPDLIQPALASWCLKTPHLPVFRATHLAALTFSLRDYCAKQSTIEPDYESDGVGIILFKGDRLTFHRLASQSLTFDSQVSSSTQPSQSDRTSLWWLPRLAELVDVRTATPNAAPAVDLAFDAGHLSVAGFNEDAHGDPRPWSFCPIAFDGTAYVPGKPVFERAIGNQIRLEAKLTGAHAEIELLRQGGSSDFLLLGKLCSGKTLRIEIVNAELESLLRFKDTPFVTFGMNNRGDADFEAFYQFFGLPFGPVPADTEDGSGDLARPCSPTAG